MAVKKERGKIEQGSQVCITPGSPGITCPNDRSLDVLVSEMVYLLKFFIGVVLSAIPKARDLPAVATSQRCFGLH